MPRTAAVMALAALAIAGAATPAASQYLLFPRIGVSAAADRYEPEITVDGDDTFEVHVLVLGPEDGTPLTYGFSRLNWAVLEACCGGAAEIVEADLAPGWQHDGSCIGGMVSTTDDCAISQTLHLATLTMRMVTEHAGLYYLLAGPIGLGLDCAGTGVVMTDTQVLVHYTNGDPDVPVESTTWGAIKSQFHH